MRGLKYTVLVKMNRMLGKSFKGMTFGNCFVTDNGFIFFDQEWMAQNLDYRYVLSETDSNSFCYNDSLEYCKKYGRLYTWAAAVDSVSIEKNGYGTCGFQALCNFSEDEKLRGICPEGYRIPNKTDWITLLESIMTGIEDKGS